MSDLFSSLLIFTIIKTIFKYIFFTVSKFYKNLVKWALTEIESSVAGTTTLDREWVYDMYCVDNRCLKTLPGTNGVTSLPLSIWQLYFRWEIYYF